MVALGDLLQKIDLIVYDEGVALLTSAEAAELLGVGPTAVKRWADSGVLACVKTAGGHRRFERAVLLDFGRGRSDAGRSSDSWLSILLSAPDFNFVAAKLFEERAARGAWHLVAARVGEVLRELGEQWAAKQITVADEHLASSRLQVALSIVAVTLPVVPPAPSCLLATADGDDHTLGLALVDLCLREAGWRTEMLGRATRAKDIVERVNAGRVQMVGLSASRASTDRALLARLARTVGNACSRAEIPLVLGGEGAWPDPPPSGMRFRELPRFFHFLTSARFRAHRRYP